VRHVRLDGQGVVVEDKVSGFTRRAVLRWRLQPGAWNLSGQTLRGEGFVLRIDADAGISSLNVVDGWESRYYLQKTRLPVLEVELRTPGTISTRITKESP
ncbi:MAG: heparinase II/III family protein, partial [Gammaproteobacteria bacterium]|nr:heparinase II/III family protein [Gammaproteobacteria bacterium]